MDLCNDCEYKGYSPELCEMHLNHIASVQEKLNKKEKAITRGSKNLNIKTPIKTVLHSGAYALIKVSGTLGSTIGSTVGTLKSLCKTTTK